MKYADMKSALKRLFNKSSATTTQSAIIKQEETFYSKAKYKSPEYLSSNNKTTIKHIPLNKHGEISRCVVCDSNMHWPDKCPHKNEAVSAYLVEGNDSGDDDDNLEEINTVLITEEDDKSEIFVAEASKSAVIDTTCTKTVADEKWFKNYTSDLTEKARKETTCPSNTSFKFGDGRKVQALKRVLFPVHLFLSHLDKIHKQFGHASVANMEKLLRNTNLLNPELSALIKEVVNMYNLY